MYVHTCRRKKSQTHSSSNQKKSCLSSPSLSIYMTDSLLKPNIAYRLQLIKRYNVAKSRLISVTVIKKCDWIAFFMAYLHFTCQIITVLQIIPGRIQLTELIFFDYFIDYFSIIQLSPYIYIWIVTLENIILPLSYIYIHIFNLCNILLTQNCQWQTHLIWMKWRKLDFFDVYLFLIID